MTVGSGLPGPIPGRPSGAQQRFANTSVSRQIAPLTGSDTNSGVPGSPWRTWRRYLDYVGSAFIDSNAVHVIEYLEDAPASDPILPPNVGSTGTVYIQAAASAITTLRTSTFTAVQVNNPALNLAYEVTDGALDWTPYAQKQILDVNGNVIAYVLKNIGGGVARVSIPSANFVVGDTYRIRSVPTIGAIKFTNSVVAGGTINIFNLEFVDGCFVPTLGFVDIVGNSAVAFSQCHLGGGNGRPMQGTYSANECMVVDPNWTGGAPVLNNVGALGDTTQLAIVSDTAIYMTSCVFQSALVFMASGAIFAINPLGIFDSPGNGIQLDGGSSVVATADLYGAGNASHGAVVFTGNNAITWVAGAPTLTGAIGDVSVGGATVAWAAAPLDTFGAVIAQSV